MATEVDVDVATPVIVAALVIGNDAVILIDPPWTVASGLVRA